MGSEVQPPGVEHATPLPIQLDAISSGDALTPPQLRTTPDVLLTAIAANNTPWFPAEFAAAKGISRDTIDEPLAELRLAGLIEVAEWVKGLGQGYVLTKDGKTTAESPKALEELRRNHFTALAAASPPVQEMNDTDQNEADSGTRTAPGTELVLRPALIVPALLIANVIWFIVCAAWSIRWGVAPSRLFNDGHRGVLERCGAVTGELLLNGEWWRLGTSCFVHIGALHLIANMFVLAMMGPLAELLWGRMRLVLIYAISGIMGSALAMTLRPDSLVAGASGAIWGIQMSLFVWLLTYRQLLPSDLASDWFRRLSVVFVLNAGISFLPGVSWEGHLGGGLGGIATALLLNAARFGTRPRRIAAWTVLVLLPFLTVAAAKVAMEASMSGWQQLRQRLATQKQLMEEAERRQKLMTAQGEFREQVLLRLDQLSPEKVKGLERLAGIRAQLDPRPPEQVAAIRTNLEQLKSEADLIVQFTSREPTGHGAFDHYRERVRSFAAARSRSFELLLEMLAAPPPPSGEQWNAWQLSRKEADMKWAEIDGK